MKLYVVTRNDLTLQYQLPQAIHAVVQFSMEFPDDQRSWFNTSNTVVVLAAKDKEDLDKFAESLKQAGVRHSLFYEPDIGNELTALTIVPTPEAKKLCSKFKLAGK